MTTKTVAVQLLAMTSQYQAQMAKATASTTKLQGAATGAGSMIGKVMGPQIAIAGAVAAGVAAKMALDWDNAFTKIGAITNTSQAQVEKWKTQVMDLSGETARSPQELADALYFLASAGLETDQVMSVLEMSAKAAAVGLGETQDIARLTAQAMNAYASSGLTAAEVTDTLVAAVREGTAEPTEFADAMGRIMPIASKAKVGFDEIAASLAGLSNIGLDVNEGVTAMRGVLVALEAPGSQAAEALAQIGFSADDVRRSLAEDGLIATLRLLDEASNHNIDTLRKIVPNVRALTGVFGLTEQEAQKVTEMFERVVGASGDVNKALDKTKDSAGHQLRQAFADLQVIGIQIGEEVLPLVVGGLQLIADVAGPVADALGLVIDALDLLAQEFGVQPDTPTVVVNLEAYKKALEDGTVAADAAQRGLNELKRQGGLTAHEIEVMQAAIDAAKGALDEADPAVEAFGETVTRTARDLAQAEAAADKFADAIDELTQVAFDVEEAQLNWHQGLIDLREELKTGAKVLDLNSQAGIDNREALKGQLENALAVGIAMREKGVSERRAAEITDKHVRAVRDEAIAAGFAKDEVDDYIRSLNLTPKDIKTIIRNTAREAAADLDAYWQKLWRLNGQSVTTYVNQVVTTETREGPGVGHAGGVIGNLPRYHGGGTLKPDERLVVGRVGETIRTAAQERALQSATSVNVIQGPPQKAGVSVAVRLDRRRFTDELDHDATYAGRWSG